VTVVLVLGCAVLGLAVGPFLVTLVDRVPDRDPLRPAAVACPQCGVASSELMERSAVLRLVRSSNRCGACGERRPADEPAIELATAALFAAAAARFGWSWVLVPYLVLFAALVVASAIDIRWFRIPDRIVFPTLAVSLPLIVVVSLYYDAGAAIRYALVGAVTYFVALFIPHLVYPPGMGFGDVKLALLMGLFIGWLAVDGLSALYLVLLALIVGCVLGVVMGAAIRIVTRRRGAFPFGPALAASTVAIVLASESLLRDYVGT
jgi:leader peptidase (prepilin peptidase)/N-methyltransferase